MGKIERRKSQRKNEIIYNQRRLDSMLPVQPELVSSYVDFVKYRNQTQKEGKIDLKGRNWLNSTGVLY
ncbi:MAG: hypothetical protein ACYDAO_10125 [Thermoplasmataceae archaeon]